MFLVRCQVLRLESHCVIEETKMREDSMISQYRNRLDKTLSSPDLTNVETLKILVKDQIVNSSKVQPEGWIEIFFMNISSFNHLSHIFEAYSMKSC